MRAFLGSPFGIIGVVHSPLEKDVPTRRRNGWQRFARWLEPGLGVKRWMVVLVFATALIGLGVAILLLDIYRAHPNSPWLAVLSLRALPRWMRAALLGTVGFGLLVFAVYRLNQSLLEPYVRPGKSVVDAVARHRRLGRGARVVAIGGGTGLSTLLRGMKQFSSNLTAIVTMADDGGSSGRLRRSLNLPPPGDVRNCLAALSDDEDLITRLFQYRFTEGGELGGHSFGNLFIAALSGVTGSFDQGLFEAGNVLGVRGNVVPSTLANVALEADKTPELAAQAIRVEGESHISDLPGRIRRVHLQPNDPPAFPGAIQAILNADMIVIGPGSLFTSVLPNLLVPDLAQAIRASRAFKVYVCNVATQPGETEGFDCREHVETLHSHVGADLVDMIVANDNTSISVPEETQMVEPAHNGDLTVPVYTNDLVDLNQPWRHDSTKLAETLIALLEERTGPLEAPPMETGDASSGNRKSDT